MCDLDAQGLSISFFSVTEANFCKANLSAVNMQIFFHPQSLFQAAEHVYIQERKMGHAIEIRSGLDNCKYGILNY